MVTSAQFRMARAALMWTVRQLAEKSGVHRNTIVRIEAGGGAAHRPTLAALRRALEEGGVEFTPPVDGVIGSGVALRWGVDPDKPSASVEATSEGDGKGSVLNAHGWEASDLLDELVDVRKTGQRPQAPGSVEWNDDIKAAQAAHWRARPEQWAALAETSRQCLLRAMGVSRLWDE
jgi:transcriptional regulator with XRE-family HTH domain